MDTLASFDSTKEPLQDLLKTVRDGKTQLPDFQRGWVWDDDHIRSLLASVTLSYPIGAVMLLETGNPTVRFKPRLVEGVTLAIAPEPEKLILDGQQRLTSLYLALFSNQPVATVDTRGNQIKRWYYLDIKKALNPGVDREDAILSLPEDKITKDFQSKIVTDCSTLEKECEAEIFPLALAFDTARLTAWQLKYIESQNPERMRERLNRWNDLVQNVVQRLQQYLVPLIVLKKQTPKVAVCQVFEKVNTGGVSLTVFELLTATFAADEFDLRTSWTGIDKRLRKHKVLVSIQSSDFLQTVALLTTYALKKQKPDAAISCKRKDILELEISDYTTWAGPALAGYEQAAKFLHMQKIFDHRDLPYRTQLVPLAATFAVLGDLANGDSARKKVERWYWCGVFGELYGGAIETRFANDLPDLVSWITNAGGEPHTVQDANFAPNRLYTLRTRNSAAYKGVSALLMREGGLDFRTGDPIDVQIYFSEQIDIHHIFPKSYCVREGFERKEWDCVVNKTPLAYKTNRHVIRGDPPSLYLKRIQDKEDITKERMDCILESHLIDPRAIRSDSFGAFFDARKTALLDKIYMAMGKSAASQVAVPEANDLPENDGDEDDDTAE